MEDGEKATKRRQLDRRETDDKTRNGRIFMREKLISCSVFSSTFPSIAVLLQPRLTLK